MCSGLWKQFDNSVQCVFRFVETVQQQCSVCVQVCGNSTTVFSVCSGLRKQFNNSVQCVFRFVGPGEQRGPQLHGRRGADDDEAVHDGRSFMHDLSGLVSSFVQRVSNAVGTCQQ